MSLTVTNAQGSNTKTLTNYITYNNNVPVAATCTPSTLSYCCGYGIYNVTLNTINNTSANGSAGYEDFTCQHATTLVSGFPFPVSIQTNPNNNQDTYVWIDYDNNGTFSAAELVFSALNTKNPTGNITPPVTAVTGVPLRMRVSSDFAGGNVLTGCSNLTNGQAEDYTVTIQPNTGVPIVNFTVSNHTICSPVVQFTNQTQNTTSSVSYTWSFGDNTTSTQINPLHTYPNVPGTYSVKLKACNGTLCDSITKSNFITIDPTLATCDTVQMQNGVNTVSTSCTGVLLDDGGINGNYADNFDGTVTIAPPGAASLSLTFQSFTFENPWDRLVIHDGPNISSPIIGTYSGTTLPGGGTINSTTGSLTIRQITDNFVSLPGFVATWACTTSTVAPTAQFSAQLGNICTGSVPFTDLSAGGPTSWTWNFGDGNTSNQQNPTHVYATATAASYTVTLTACNTNGCNSIVKPNYVNITVPCVTYCASTGHNNSTNWISQVQYGTINNTTGPDPNGYGDYSSISTSAQIGVAIPFTVTMGAQFGRTLSIWVDLNHNGTFEIAERLYNAFNTVIPGGFGFTGMLTIPTTAQLGNTRMRLVLRQINNPNLNNDPCVLNMPSGEVEDYTINVTGNNTPPIANFIASPSSVFSGTPVVTCTGIVSFLDQSTNGPTSWSWNFGDPASGAANTSTLQNPSHTYLTPGLYTVVLTATNALGTNTVTKTNYLSYNPAYALCDSIIIPASGGTLPTITSCTGNIYDSGGPTGNYLNNNNSTVTIAPTGATNVVLNFNQFNYEFNDGIFVYDGPSVASPQVPGSPFSGNALPNGGIITSTGGAITIREQTNPQISQFGFAASWTCIQANQPPIPLFASNQAQICNGLVSFSSQSAGAVTSYSWNFGDGNTSTLVNPTHSYAAGTPGTYTVSLTVCNANGCSTLVKPNHVAITVPCYCSISAPSSGTQWISNVTLGSINNTSTAAPNGYANYTSQVASLTAGNTYPFSVTLGTAFPKSLSIWIDFNQNGTFNFTEKVYGSSANATSFAGTIQIPINATLGNTRIRIFTRDNPNNNDPCASNLAGAEVEDYTINIQANTQPPTAAFQANPAYTCSGQVNFANLSQGSPTSFTWTFGDNTTSTLQSPGHNYAAPGLYTVKLKVCNAFGCDSVTKVNYIHYANTQPAAAACTPATTSYVCCNGIGQVQFNLLNNSSADAIAGYENFTCGMSDTVAANSTYVLRVNNSSADAENVRAYIDFNNNGSFADPGEWVMSSTNATVHADSVLIPLTATRYTHLRMRVMSERVGLVIPPTACSNLIRGQAEDYTIFITDPVGRPEELAAAVKLFPNPSAGRFTIVVPGQTAAVITITNVLGETVQQLQGVSGTASVDLGAAAKGMYLVKIAVDQTVIMKKIVIE